MRSAVVIVVLGACGRFGFEPGRDVDGSPGDGPIRPAGLVAKYSMEGDPSDGVVDDDTGDGHSATCSGASCPRAVPGRHGQGLAFDGATQFLRVANAPALNNPDSFTVAAWVFLDQQTSIHSAVAKPFGAENDNSFNLMMQSAGACMEWATATTTDQVLCDGGPVKEGRWVHLLQRWDGTTVAFHVDGAVVVTQELAERIAFDNRDMLIGSDENSGAPARFWPGIIDEVCLFDRALEPDEIAELSRS